GKVLGLVILNRPTVVADDFLESDNIGVNGPEDSSYALYPNAAIHSAALPGGSVLDSCHTCHRFDFLAQADAITAEFSVERDLAPVKLTFTPCGRSTMCPIRLRIGSARTSSGIASSGVNTADTPETTPRTRFVRSFPRF